MSKEIKQNLFRFVTVRNPQLIDKKEGHPGFVFHPNGSSVFSEVIADSTNPEELRAGIQEQANEMAAYAFKTRKEVAAINENLYAFSNWLMRNKNNLTYNAIQDNLNGATLLNIEQKEDIKLWENLIYQTITKQSVYVREALIQMLIANQFLNEFINRPFEPIARGGGYKFTEAELKEFTRRACASVVISKELFSDEVKPVPSKRRKLTASQENAMLKAIEVETAKESIDAYKILEKELKTIETKYNKDSQKAYDAALSKHEATVDNLMAQIKPVFVEEIDPETGVKTTTKTYPGLELPTFTFDKEIAINSRYLNGKLSASSMALFNTEELDVYDEFSEVYTVINTKIQTQNQVVAAGGPKTSSTVVVGGVSTTVGGSTFNLEPYCFFAARKSLISTGQGLSMFLGTGYANATASNASVKLLNLDTNIEYTGTSVETRAGLNDSTVRLFFAIPQPIDNSANYRFSGTFSLDNGVTLRFDVTNSDSMRFLRFNGCCEIVKGDDTIDPIDISKPELFGITNLGIADFRRVEQEVCCYVPGEVSHIENIMAREYKERATRSLNSIETTSEETTEQETEKLTDTTTTERNEMQSEVSSVINEDESKNYGANASVSGKLYGSLNFSAGAYFDASTSSSTSNSNSQAQTYAQEVTERAMERIVRKVSKKRTSRILKEFEENNKHGFDNTKGDKHITGVYRWIDKIYKNKLINYGKRLMYEFAIPEPARFFKEAIFKQTENSELDSAVVLPTKPTHPKNLSYSIKMRNAEDLNKGNYKEIAGLYNAEVPAFPEQYKTVSKQEVIDVWGDSGRWVRSGGFDIDIPDGYKAKNVKGYFDPRHGNHSATWSNMHAELFIGGKKIYVPGQTSNFPINVSFVKPITEVVGVSLTSWDIGIYNFNLTVDCELTDAVMDAWRNETFNAIMNAYNDRLREYNEAMLAKELGTESNGETLKFNPLQNRSLERKELKRVAIELLIDQNRVSKDNYTAINETTGVSKVIKNQGLQNHAATVKFFEQAFDWDIMSYIFYPYFYAKEENWKELFQSQEAADPIFQAFLQSGMARTVIPVRPGFEDAVNWYMATGEIWNGEGLVTDQDNDLYVSIAEEMQTIEGEVEKSWETRLPTSLTVIQAGSIGLKVEGLPCNLDCDDFALFDSDGKPILDANGEQVTDNPIKQTNTLIGGNTTEEALPPTSGGTQDTDPVIKTTAR
ncbi:hypothetical protein [Pontimicrobium sp. MEBiC06410]